ncbi:TMhelix containing protein [Vibrio phage 468E53-1]|nr:TMhelix containing protein [Vibrio phage 468E53-1]
MTSDIKKPSSPKLPPKASQWLRTFLFTFLVMLGVHISVLLLSCWDSLSWSPLVKGFDLVAWGSYGRRVALVPYLVLPIIYASTSVAGYSLTDLAANLKSKIKAASQAIEQGKTK